MSTIVKEFYKAFIEAGVSEETANRVAERFDKSQERFISKDGHDLVGRSEFGIVKVDLDKVKTDLEVIKSELRFMKWMIGGLGFPTMIAVFAMLLQMILGA